MAWIVARCIRFPVKGRLEWSLVNGEFRKGQTGLMRRRPCGARRSTEAGHEREPRKDRRSDRRAARVEAGNRAGNGTD